MLTMTAPGWRRRRGLRLPYTDLFPNSQGECLWMHIKTTHNETEQSKDLKYMKRQMHNTGEREGDGKRKG